MIYDRRFDMTAKNMTFVLIGHRRSVVRTPMPEFFWGALKFWSRKATFLDFGHFFTHIEDSKTEIFVTNTYADFRHQGAD